MELKTQDSNRTIPITKIREIAHAIDIHRLLSILNVKMSRDNGYEMRGCCPIHHGDNTTSFSITYGSKSKVGPWWYCRTGCHKGGDVFQLIMSMKNISFVEAVIFVAELVGYDIASLSSEEPVINEAKVLHDNDVNQFIEESGIGCERMHGLAHSDLNDEFVSECQNRRNGYFKKRGFEDALLDFFRVGYCPAYMSEWHEARVTIPFYFADNSLAGISGRALYDCADCKYQIMSGSRKAECLYNLNNALPYIKERRSVIVTEGFAHVWRSWQYGKRNIVAVMGKDLTAEQEFMLVSMADTVAVAFDNDEEGRKGAEDTIEKLARFCNVYQAIPPAERDLADLSYNEFMKVMKRAKKVA